MRRGNSSRVSASNPPPMPDTGELEASRRVATLELEAARRVAPLTLAELCNSSSASPPCSNLPALLRRCIKLLPLLEQGDPILAARCCHGLLASLRAILSRDPSPSLLPAIEVFLESIASSDRLMSYLVITTNNGAPEGSGMFSEAAPYEEEHIMLELVCRHFISTLLEEGASEEFLSALSWSGRALQRTPETSFKGAFALVQRTYFFSLPDVVQAHVLLLMSRCFSDQNLNMHIRVFAYAMDLYLRYLPALPVFNRTDGAKTPLNSLGKKKTYSCTKATFDQTLRSQIYRLLSFCERHRGDGLPVDENDIDTLIKENQHMFHEKFSQQRIVPVKSCFVPVKCILSNILCRAKQKGALEPDVEVSDDIICLAAALRLMGSSILHILCYFSQMRSVTGKKHENYVARCKVHNDIYETISLLRQHETNELHRYDLYITGKSVDSESASMLMFAHFANLSTCCLTRRLGFLWKDCVMMMMMATHLIAEEQSLSTLHLSMDVSKESATKVRISEVSARTKEIILRYKSVHRFLPDHFYGDGTRLGTPEECNSRVRKANGQRFFECHPEYSRNSWADILDCVECEEGKDYSNVLQQLQKFRQTFKYGKWVNRRGSRRQSIMDNLGLKKRRRT